MNLKLRLPFLIICALFVVGISILIAWYLGHHIGSNTGLPGSQTIVQTKSKKSNVEPKATKINKPNIEPKDFNEEGDPNIFENSVDIPGNVLDAIRATKEAKSMQDKLKDYDRDDFAQLFKAVVIHLGGPKETDYVLLSEFPMGGASAPWFWIVRYDQSHPKVIFFTNSNSFSLQETKNSGYPDIDSEWCSAASCITRIYQYNGQRYILVHEYHTENEPEP